MKRQLCTFSSVFVLLLSQLGGSVYADEQTAWTADPASALESVEDGFYEAAQDEDVTDVSDNFIEDNSLVDLTVTEETERSDDLEDDCIIENIDEVGFAEIIPDGITAEAEDSEIMPDGMATETETESELPDPEEPVTISEDAEDDTDAQDSEGEILCAADSGITINAEEVTLYYLRGNYTEYISSIPEDMPTSFQINVSGANKKERFVRRSGDISVDDSGFVTILPGSGSRSSSGEIEVTVDGETIATVKVNLVSYERYYVEQIVNADIERLGIRNLNSDYEKVSAICNYVSKTYNYSPKSSSMMGEVLTGGADCIGNSDLVCYMCEQCGIPAHIRNANFVPGAGAGHENNIVKIDGEYYIVDCGYTGDAPRSYQFYKVSNDFEYSMNSDGTICLDSYMRFDLDVVTIPAQLDGYKVSSIRSGMLQEDSYSRILVEEGSEYFSSRNNALCTLDGKKLIACPQKTAGCYTIPNGVETIGEKAFMYCKDITQLTMPDSVTAIEDHAFLWCNKMSEVNWSDSLEVIGNDAFSACESLKEIIFPESLRVIGADSFAASMHPEAVYIPSGVTSIGAGAFLRVPFMVIETKDPELGHHAVCECTTFCYPGSTVDTVCTGPHYDINLLDENKRLVLRKEFFTVDQSDKVYKGTEQTPLVQNTEDYKWLEYYDWKWSDEKSTYVKQLIRDNYDVTYKNNVNAGTGTIVISGKNRCTGTLSYTFKIKPQKIFSSSYYSYRLQFKDSGSRLASFKYTGEEIRPEVDICKKGTVDTSFLPGRDYTLTYSDNTDIGYETGTITLNGIGNYAGTDTIHFTIKGSLPEPEPIPDQQYTGSSIEPEVIIPGLPRDNNYSVFFENNMNPGRASVTVQGYRCYEGSWTIYFSIIRELPEISRIADCTYTGAEIRPNVYIPGAIEGTDYMLEYSNNTEVGTATVTATGVGYYTGTQTAEFRITAPGSSLSEGSDYDYKYMNPTIKLNAFFIPLKVGQSTRKLKVSGLQKGDSVWEWASSNTKIVTVNQKGVIKAGKKTGTAYIGVWTDYGAFAMAKVSVQKKKVAAKKISVVRAITLKKGEKYSLNAKVTPITVTDKIKYKSSKKKIATVSGKGVITAKKKGKTTITVKCGKKKIRVKVLVK